MLQHVERYIALRRSLNFKLRDPARNLRHLARFVEARGEALLYTQTLLDWASQGPSPHACYVRFRDARQLAMFLQAEDPSHQVPGYNPFKRLCSRRLPYILTQAEIERLIAQAGRLRRTYPLRRLVYRTLFGLLASTGLRVSEALALKLQDVCEEGYLSIRCTKFAKSRYIPLHPTAFAALNCYLEQRLLILDADDHLFISIAKTRLSYSTVQATYSTMLRFSGVGSNDRVTPRIHDLRHTFATRALERFSPADGEINRHMVALATYMGHAEIASTYWYLQATPQLMVESATAAEALMHGGGK